MSLPRCLGKDCPVEPESCRRYIPERGIGRQVWVKFYDDRRGGCVNFMKTKKAYRKPKD